MAMPTHFQVMNPPVQNPMGGTNLHTPQSIFQHIMGPQNMPTDQASWTQMPQVPPMYMPWTVPSLQQPQFVRFTGEQPSPLADRGFSLCHKRKLENPETPTPQPTKQFITEEKMAAHFRNMHISSNYQPTPAASVEDCQPSTSSQPDVDVPESNFENGKSVHPRLVISEELKRLPQEPLLPAALLSKLERPSMALVLWEPPSKYLRMLTQPQTVVSDDGDGNNNDNINNNNEEIADLNVATFNSGDMELEPMDL